MNTERINEINEQIKEIEERKAELEQRKADMENKEDESIQQYRDMIDDTVGDIEIFNMSYCASRVLEEIDPIAFNCGYNDYFDEKLSEIENELSDINSEIETLQEDKQNVKDEVV